MVGEVGGRRGWEKRMGEEDGREDDGREDGGRNIEMVNMRRRQRKIGRQCEGTLQEDAARGRCKRTLQEKIMRDDNVR
jgi:hypothetical protein